MSYTLIDYFNAFQQLKRKKDFSAGVQSAYFSILAEFNLQRFPAKLYLSTRELKQLAGLKSVSSAQEARNVLKNNHLIDFHTENGTTAYILGTEHLPNTNRTLTEQQVPNQPNTNRTPHALVSTLPVYPQETKTLKQEENNTQSAGANVTELDRFLDSWEAGNGCKLSQWLVSKLNVLMTRYGFAKMSVALELANKQANGGYGFSLEFFEKRLAEVSQSPKSVRKGGESSAKSSVDFTYKPVDFDYDEPLW